MFLYLKVRSLKARFLKAIIINTPLPNHLPTNIPKSVRKGQARHQRPALQGNQGHSSTLRGTRAQYFVPCACTRVRNAPTCARSRAVYRALRPQERSVTPGLALRSSSWVYLVSGASPTPAPSTTSVVDARKYARSIKKQRRKRRNKTTNAPEVRRKSATPGMEDRLLVTRA